MASPHPLIEIRVQVRRRDFALGYALMRQRVSPLHLPGVQAGLCLTAAGLCGCMVPTCAMYLGNVFVPVCAGGFFLFLAGLCMWAFPSLLRTRAAVLFDQNKTLALPYTLRIFPDRFLWENEFESVTAYWTDVDHCFENGAYYVLRGDLQKPLLVIPKATLGQEETELLSRFFRGKLAVRYRGGERT